MRRTLLIAAGAVVLLVVIVLGFLSASVDRFRPRIQTELQKKLGRQVTLGHIGLKLFPLAIRVEDVTVAEAAGFPSNAPFAKAKELDGSVAFFSLLSGNPEVKSVRLEHPQIELIRNVQGVWNFSTLGAQPSPSPAGQNNNPKQPSENPKQSSEFSLDDLEIADGQVALTDIAAHEPRAVYNGIDLSLTDFGPGKKFGLGLDVHLPGKGKELVSFKGNAGPLDSGNTAATPISGNLSIQEVSVSGFNRFMSGSLPAETDAALTGEAKVDSEGQTVTCKGNLKAQDAVIRGTKLGYPIDSQYDLTLDRKSDKLTIRSGVLKLRETAVNLSGTVDSGPKPAVVDANLKTKNANIAELLDMAKGFGVNGTQGMTASGRVSLDAHVQGPTSDLSKLTYSGTGNIAGASIKAEEIVLTNVQSNCRLDHGVVTLNPLTADVFGGKENGTLSIDTKPAHPLCSVNAKLSGVDTNALLSAMSSAKNTLYGALSADAKLGFALASSNDLARTLNGTLSFDVADGQLKNVNILKELAKVGKFLGAAPSQSGSETKLKKLAGTLDINNGLANTNNLTAVLDVGSLSSNGTLNLVDQGLKMHVTAVLGQSVSQAAGGTSVGGYMNTALANNRGELVLPVVVTGTLAHPVFVPDVQAIAKMKLSHLLPDVSDPGKLATGVAGSVLNNKGAGGIVNGILGGGQQKQQQPQSTQQNPKEQNPIDSIFNKLNKKKDTKQ